MSVSKCYLCHRKLKGGDWMLIVIDGQVQKICKDKRTCKQHQEMRSVKCGEGEDDSETGATVYRIVFDWQCCAVIVAGLIAAIIVGIAVAVMAIMICS